MERLDKSDKVIDGVLTRQIQTRPLPPHLKYRSLDPISEVEFRHILDRYGVMPREDGRAPEERPQPGKPARKRGDSVCTE